MSNYASTLSLWGGGQYNSSEQFYQYSLIAFHISFAVAVPEIDTYQVLLKCLKIVKS